MKILIINGSPKKTGRTKEISNIVVKSFDEKIDLSYIKLSEERINYCKGLLTCFKNGECPLSRNDNFDNILEQIMLSDGIVLITPVYVHHIPGIFKNLIDRLAYLEHFFPLSKKYFSIIVHANSNGVEQTQAYLEKIFLTMGAHHSKSIGNLMINDDQDEFQKQILQLSNQLISDIQKRKYQVTPYQNKIFTSLKSIIEFEKVSDSKTYKSTQWEDLLGYKNYSDYIENLLMSETTLN